MASWIIDSSSDPNIAELLNPHDLAQSSCFLAVIIDLHPLDTDSLSFVVPRAPLRYHRSIAFSPKHEHLYIAE